MQIHNLIAMMQFNYKDIPKMQVFFRNKKNRLPQLNKPPSRVQANKQFTQFPLKNFVL